MHVSHHGSTIFTLNTPTFLSRCGRLNWLVSPLPVERPGASTKSRKLLCCCSQTHISPFCCSRRKFCGKIPRLREDGDDDSRQGGRWEKIPTDSSSSSALIIFGGNQWTRESITIKQCNYSRHFNCINLEFEWNSNGLRFWLNDRRMMNAAAGMESSVCVSAVS
jgi:hypothetical protein